MRCACGESFDSHQLEESLIHVPGAVALAEVLQKEVYAGRTAAYATFEYPEDDPHLFVHA
jgi:hypothetical protein